MRGAKVADESLKAFTNIELATQELSQFEFLRNDLMIKFESMVMGLVDTFERMKSAEKKHAKDFEVQTAPVISKKIAQTKKLSAKSKGRSKTQ